MSGLEYPRGHGDSHCPCGWGSLAHASLHPLRCARLPCSLHHMLLWDWSLPISRRWGSISRVVIIWNRSSKWMWVDKVSGRRTDMNIYGWVTLQSQWMKEESYVWEWVLLSCMTAWAKPRDDFEKKETTGTSLGLSACAPSGSRTLVCALAHQQIPKLSPQVCLQWMFRAYQYFSSAGFLCPLLPLKLLISKHDLWDED